MKREPLPHAPHTMTGEALCRLLDVDPDTGLDGREAAARLAAGGRNSIRKEKTRSAFLLFLDQMKSPFMLLLLLAAGVSFYFGDWTDGIVILIVVGINAAVGFIMEYQAGQAMEALKRLTQSNAKVMRDGRVQEIPSEELVPGDILVAEGGDVILADARILHRSRLSVDESALTGESIPVEKIEAPLEEDTTLAERENMLYKGTFISAGNVTAVVTGTGMQTEFGKIAELVQSATQTTTPLEKKVERFGRKLILLTAILVVVIFVVGLLRDNDLVYTLKTAVALAVAAIPEGLPIVVTLVLARGMVKMARHNAIVRKFSAVETLGETTVICTDKTGTLTQNRIEVEVLIVPGEEPLTVAKIKPGPAHELITRISVLCNTADISVKDDELVELGDPLETGLLKFAHGQGIDITAMRKQFPKLKEEPFTSETKLMATLHRGDGTNFIAAKGAAEALVERCAGYMRQGEFVPMNEAEKKEWIAQAEKLAVSGLRVLAAAYKEVPGDPAALSDELVFAGLIGMLDPPREDVADAISACRSAGIRVVMITGDHPATAKNIARTIGLVDSDDTEVLHGKAMPDYEQLPAEEKRRWTETSIFARVSPKQKLDLVTVLQDQNDIVGMTGDGVNDTPALKKADIGIAMGKRGTQVAREVADMILSDDSFSTIVIAIRQGRMIFENIRKFVIYLLSCNLSELLIVAVTSLLALHYALMPLQILYINLVTDVLPALALGMTAGSDQVMKRPPRPHDEPIIATKHWFSISIYSVIIGACSIGAVVASHYWFHNSESWDAKLGNNILFVTLILSQLFHVFNMSADKTVAFFRTDVFRNKFIWFAVAICIILTTAVYFIPPAANALALQMPGTRDFLLIGGFSLLSMVLVRVFRKTTRY